MSGMELWTGTLYPINIPGEHKTFKQQVSYLESLGHVFVDLDLEEEYFCVSETKLIYRNKRWWDIKGDECDDHYLQKYRRNVGGSLDFVSYFHNGGTCLSEELGEIIDEVDK